MYKELSGIADGERAADDGDAAVGRRAAACLFDNGQGFLQFCETREGSARGCGPGGGDAPRDGRQQGGHGPPASSQRRGG